LLPLADFTDVLEKHRKSTRFLEGYWRRRDGAPAAGAIGCSRGLHKSFAQTSRTIETMDPKRGDVLDFL